MLTPTASSRASDRSAVAVWSGAASTRAPAGVAPLRYCAALDGLRGFAVLAVMAYHANVPGASGGYIGVSVFFVLSGYLVGRTVLTDPRPLAFFARRAARIVPALVVVGLLVAFTSALVPPSERTGLGHSLMGSAGFIANILDWRTSGYFAADTALQPLSHLWSLSVEEQAYLFLPLVPLALAVMGGRRVAMALGGLLLASFALAVWLLESGRGGAAYYLLPSRAWEIGTGVLLALWLAKAPPVLPRAVREAGVGMGLAAIAATIMLYGATTPYPGPAALIPVGGAALIVLMTHRGPQDTSLRAEALLVTPLMVTAGLLAYTLYLWHQPVLALARGYGFDGPLATGGALGLAVGLAVLTTVLVERPVRALRWGSGAVLAASAVGLCVLAGAGGVVSVSGAGSAAVVGVPSSHRSVCHATRTHPVPPERACVHEGSDRPRTGGAASVAVLGDSHAVELAEALGAVAAGGVRQHSFSFCRPHDPAAAHDDPCARWTRHTVAALLADPGITTVVLSYRLHLYVSGDHRRAYPGTPKPRSDAAAILTDLERLVVHLSAAGKRVIIVRQAPELPRPLAFLAHSAPSTDDIKGGTRVWWEARRAPANPLWARLKTPIIIDPAALFCAEHCRGAQDGRLLYFDDNHISLSGAEVVAASVPVPGNRANPKAIDHSER